MPAALWVAALLGLLCGACSSPEPAPTAAPPEPPAAATAPAAQPAAPAAEEQKLPLPEAVTQAPAPFEGTGWQDLFDGDSLEGWRITDFAGRGEVECRSGVVVLNMGNPFTGVNYTNTFPKVNYEVALDAMRVMGTDFFCGLTLPYKDSHFTLIVGGWGGGLVGISSLNEMDASENDTTKYIAFEKGKWYRVRVRATDNRLEAWIDNEKVANVTTKDRRISLRPGEIENSAPVGIASWQTAAAFRAVKLRSVTEPAGPPPKF